MKHGFLALLVVTVCPLPLLAEVAACGQLCSAEARRSYARLNAVAVMTRHDAERAAFLIRRDDGHLDVHGWPPGGPAEASYTGRIPPHCIAIIHTHPPGTPKPSARDIAEAQRLGIPILAITPDSVTAAMTDGTTMQVFPAGWLRKVP